MNTDRTEKFVNAIACDLEEGGFRQVSGTTLRRTLATAVTAALPLLEAGNPVPGLSEQEGLAFDVDDARERFEEWAKGRDLTPDTWGVSSYVSPHVDNDWDVWRAAWKALAATGKQQVGENPAWRDELVREAHARGLMEGLNHPRRRQAIEVQQPEYIRDVHDVEQGLIRNPDYVPAKQVGEVKGDALVQEALAYFERAGDAGDRKYVEAIRNALAARPPRAQEAVAYWLAVDKDGVVEFGMSADDANGGQASRQEVNDFINGPLHEGGVPHRLVEVYAAPPAQGIDLGQLRELAESWKGVCDPDPTPIMQAHQHANHCCADELLALIDGQRDAAPGVGS